MNDVQLKSPNHNEVECTCVTDLGPRTSLAEAFVEAGLELGYNYVN